MFILPTGWYRRHYNASDKHFTPLERGADNTVPCAEKPPSGSEVKIFGDPVSSKIEPLQKSMSSSNSGSSSYSCCSFATVATQTFWHGAGTAPPSALMWATVQFASARSL